MFTPQWFHKLTMLCKYLTKGDKQFRKGDCQPALNCEINVLPGHRRCGYSSEFYLAHAGDLYASVKQSTKKRIVLSYSSSMNGLRCRREQLSNLTPCLLYCIECVDVSFRLCMSQSIQYCNRLSRGGSTPSVLTIVRALHASTEHKPSKVATHFCEFFLELRTWSHFSAIICGQRLLSHFQCGGKFALSCKTRPSKYSETRTNFTIGSFMFHIGILDCAMQWILWHEGHSCFGCGFGIGSHPSCRKKARMSLRLLRPTLRKRCAKKCCMSTLGTFISRAILLTDLPVAWIFSLREVIPPPPWGAGKIRTPIWRIVTVLLRRLNGIIFHLSFY